MALTSKSKNYTLYAWQDNNIRLKVTQGEGGIKLAQFTLVDDNGAIDLTTATQVLFNGEKRNGSGCSIECEITNSTQGVITVPVETGMTDIAGDLKGVIEVITPNGNIKFDGITLYVASSPDAIIEVSNAFSALVKALNKIALLTPEGTIPLDDELTDDGVNAVQGKVIKKALDNKANISEVAYALQQKLSDIKGSVKTSNIADSSVTTPKISNGAITLEKLAEEVQALLGSGNGNGISAEVLNSMLKNYAKAEDLENKEDVGNKVTSFTSNFEDADNTKYPTIIALLEYLKDYYYDISDIEYMMESMHIDEEGSLSVTLPSWNEEQGETLVIGKIQEVDKDEIIGEINETISQQLADLTQIELNFANSIDECTDTSKVYVLPDGYIYAYISVEENKEVIAYTNKLPLSTDADGNLYNNGQGWKADTRLNSSGTEASYTGIECTGFIPFKRGDIIRFKNIKMVYKDGTYTSQQYFAHYDTNKTKLNAWVSSAFHEWVANGYATVDNELNIIQLDTGKLDASHNYGVDENAAYFRISAESITDESIITVNEEIKTSTTVTTTKGWCNTGHAFVPTDYEDRILTLEEKAADNTETATDHESRITELENQKESGIPTYVTEEAEGVIDRVIAAQGSNTFTFAAITDLHYGNASNTDGVEHACKALQYIDSRIKLDAVAVLGDYTDGYTSTDYDNAIADFKAVNAVLNDLRFAPNLRLQGNHDFYADNLPMIHRFIQSYSDDVVWGDKKGGYFYRDFEDFNFRVICINTTEDNNDFVRCSTTQYRWFINSLDLSTKDNSSDWQILVLSHHPLDWYTPNEKYKFCYILNAYKTGTSWSSDDGQITCDFNGKNTAKLIGNIHGHIHNLRSGYIYFDNPNTSTNQTDIWRISTPEACINRSNQYSGAWRESMSYPKTVNTANETSFCIYCIDLDTNKINAICYGAGYDREIEY